ncbi:hypothetical protein C8J56DRAFT_800163, partial [Mycena floridula]
MCLSCYRCVTRRRFTSIPRFSWANGCWVGDVLPELTDLTYVEELVIARAHTTKCWARITAGLPGPLAQRAAHGNVCLHPHEVTKLATVLPRPMSSLYDEIVVIFVSNNQQATEEMFKRYLTPLLVRRGRILHALQWLKVNNPLYHDIEIDMDALAEYPSDESGYVPFPVRPQYPSSPVRGQNSTYTGHGIDTTEAMFAEAVPQAENIPIPVSVTGTFDVDQTATSVNMRKLQALRQLKQGGSFVKSSTSTETSFTRNNPKVYGCLWPTLFPYGVGMFEDPVR